MSDNEVKKKHKELGIGRKQNGVCVCGGSRERGGGVNTRSKKEKKGRKKRKKTKTPKQGKRA